MTLEQELDAMRKLLRKRGYSHIDTDDDGREWWTSAVDSVSLWPDGRWDYGEDCATSEGHGHDSLLALFDSL